MVRLMVRVAPVAEKSQEPPCPPQSYMFEGTGARRHGLERLCALSYQKLREEATERGFIETLCVSMTRSPGIPVG